VLHAGKLGEPLFERLNLRAKDPLPAFNHLLNGLREQVTQPLALGLQVDEWDRFKHG